MSVGGRIVRIIIGAVGIGLMGLALWLFVTDGPLFGVWIWTFVLGLVLLIAVLVEVTRYRSQTAEVEGLRPGPGGGEPGQPEPRFRPTDEVFLDPTSHHRMRVYLDSRTGERRYVAEG